MQFEFSSGAFVYRKTGGKVYILFLLREEGWLDLPKGHFNKGESAEEVAKREVKEETGLAIELVPYFREETKYFFNSKKGRVLKGVSYFLARVESEKVKISSEHVGYRWLDYEEAMKQVKFKDMKMVLPKVFDYINRLEQVQELNRDYAKLPEITGGWNLSRNFVPGDGPLNARLMIVGQAPGRNEDEQRRPFVGRSGQLLERILKKNKIKRKDVYICSVVQFFPPKNRAPSKKETDLCIGFLRKQIEIMKPKYIILLGNVAANSLVGESNVFKAHGKVVEKDGIKYMVTFHPAAALRFKKILKPMEEDISHFSKLIKEE